MKKLRVKNLFFTNMEPLIKNPLISKGYVDICYAETNRNHSYISKEVLDNKLKPSIAGIPVVGEYYKEIEDFGDHGGRLIIDSNGIRYEATTKPYGFVPTNTNFEYVKKIDKDGIEREYLRADCYLWTGQYPECDRVFKTNNPQSMELDKDTGYWKRINGEDYFVIEDAIVSKLCILGSEVEPCFEGASFGANNENSTISYNLDKEKYEKFIKEFKLQLKEALGEKFEGGFKGMGNEDFKKKQEEEDVSKIKEKDTSKTEEKDTSEEEKKKKPSEKNTKENENEEDYVKKFNELESTLNEFKVALDKANNTIKTLNVEIENLNKYKKDVEKEKKEELFNTFKVKNIIDENDLNGIYSELDTIDYELLDFKLCKLFTEKTINSTEENKIPSVKTYRLNEKEDEKELSWVDKVAKKQRDNN